MKKKLVKIATSGMMDEKTIHKKALKNSAMAGGLGALGHAVVQERRSYFKSGGKRSVVAFKPAAKFGLGAGGISLAAQEAAILASKRGRDKRRAEIEARKEKSAGLARAGVELAGLGTLGYPSAKKLMAKPKATTPEAQEQERHERRNAKIELAGLGVLAAPEALDVARAAWRKARSIKTAAVVPPTAASAVSGRAQTLLSGAGKASKALGVVAPPAPPKPKFTLDHLQKAYQTAGLKPGVGSVARPNPLAKLAPLGKSASVKLKIAVQVPIAKVVQPGLPATHNASLKSALAKLQAARSARAVPAPPPRNAAPNMIQGPHLSMVPGGSWTGGAPWGSGDVTGLDRVRRAAQAPIDPTHVMKLHGRVQPAAQPALRPVTLKP